MWCSQAFQETQNVKSWERNSKYNVKAETFTIYLSIFHGCWVLFCVVIACATGRAHYHLWEMVSPEISVHLLFFWWHFKSLWILLDLVVSFSLCLTWVLKILEMFAILLLVHFILMRNAFPRSFCLVCPCSLYGAAWAARKKKKIPEKWDLGAEAKRRSFKGSWQPEFFWLNCWFFLWVFFVFCVQVKHV